MKASPAVVDYAEIQQFYARQFGLTDAGDLAAWESTFTEDAVFTSTAAPAPMSGRPAIRAGAQQALDRALARSVVRRHWVGMITVEPEPDGSVRTRFYVSIMGTSPQGSGVDGLAECRDLLVPVGDTWRVSRRDLILDRAGA